VVTQQRSTTIDPKSINLSNAQAIAADPTGYAGISTSGSQGSCQTVQATAGNTSTYYDSCQIGSTEQDSSFTCTVGWRDVVSTTSTYSCEQKVISGINAGQATKSKRSTAAPNLRHWPRAPRLAVRASPVPSIMARQAADRSISRQPSSFPPIPSTPTPALTAAAKRWLSVQ
jgi:hypothetical protein